MIVPHCSTLTWKELYAAADAFQEIACWEWMWDRDLFGVQNPASGEIGYCCVLGALGEVYGLVVYLGSLGLEQHLKIQSRRATAHSRDFVRSQCCLTVWFGDRRDLDETDLEVVKELGIRYRGRSLWPQFRSMRPGYVPWYLCESEAQFLTLCLEQARQVALDFARNPDLLHPPAKKHYLVRVPAGHAQDQSPQPDQQTLFPETGASPRYEWKSQWRAPEPLVKAPLKPFRLDEIRLQRIKKSCQRVVGPWEIDAFFTDQAVAGDDRPFFPYTLLCADHDSGFIFSTVLAEWSAWQEKFPEAFLEGLESHGMLPETLRLRKDDLRELLEPLALRLGIKIETTRKLPAADHARRSMLKFLETRF